MKQITLEHEMADRWLKLANYLSDEKLDGKTIFTLSFQDGCNFIVHPEGKDGKTLDLSICIQLESDDPVHLDQVEPDRDIEQIKKEWYSNGLKAADITRNDWFAEELKRRMPDGDGINYYAENTYYNAENSAAFVAGIEWLESMLLKPEGETKCK